MGPYREPRSIQLRLGSDRDDVIPLESIGGAVETCLEVR